jgi:hypothetical protein
MGEWMVQLKGHEYDILDLKQHFERTDVSIVQEQGAFFLKVNDFQRFTSQEQSGDVLKAAQGVLPTLIGLSKVRLGKHLAIKVDGRVVWIADDGTRNAYVMITTPLTIRARSRVTAALSNEPGKPPPTPPPNPNEALLKLARTDPLVATALRYFSEPEQRWYNLYKVLDTIETDVAARTNVKREDAIPNQGWATGTVLGNFTANANHAGVHGDDARHGILSGRPLSPNKVIALAEAEALMRHILNEWLNWRS